MLTRNENVLVWCADELHRFQRKEAHVFVDRIARDFVVRAVVQGDQDVQEDWIYVSTS